MSINPRDWSPESVKIVLGAVLSIALLLVARFAPDYAQLANSIAAIVAASFGASVASGAYVKGQQTQGIHTAVQLDAAVSRLNASEPVVEAKPVAKPSMFSGN